MWVRCCLAAMALSMVACAPGTDLSDEQAVSASAGALPNSLASPDPSSLADASWPRRIPLPDGSRLALALPPVRVIPASSGSVDLICGLLPPERVAALPAQALEFSNIDANGGTWDHHPRFERYVAEPLLVLRPDLVVAYSLQSPATTAVLRGAGITVLELSDPRDLAELLEQIRLLGQVTGRDREAAALVADLERREALLAAAMQGRRRLSALTYTNGGSGGWTAGLGSTQHEVLRLAGLTNAAARNGRISHGRIDYEELLTLNPDVIVVASDDEGRSVTAGLLEVESALAGLRAVQTGSIVVLPGRLFSATSQAMLTAAESVAAQVEAFALAPTEAAR